MTTELFRSVGELQGTVNALGSEVEKLRKQVELLTALLNQGKGAKWLLLLIPSMLGGLGAMAGYFGVKSTTGL
jgi:hypothetical protein